MQIVADTPSVKLAFCRAFQEGKYEVRQLSGSALPDMPRSCTRLLAMCVAPYLHNIISFRASTVVSQNRQDWGNCYTASTGGPNAYLMLARPHPDMRLLTDVQAAQGRRCPCCSCWSHALAIYSSKSQGCFRSLKRGR